MQFYCFNFFEGNLQPLHVYPLHPYESGCGIGYTMKSYIFKMAGIQLAAYSRVDALIDYE